VAGAQSQNRGMERRVLMLAAPALVFALAASAQEQAPSQPAPPSPAIESVIVTAPALRPEKALDNFIISHAAPSPLLNKIARWKTGICPITIGLTPKLNLYVTQRIIRVAMMAGAPLDSKEPCRPNVSVLATPQPQELLDMLRTKHGALLGYHYMSQARDIATMHFPIQAWYSTATEDYWGFIQADEPGLRFGKITPKAEGMASILHVSGFHGNDGLKSQFATAIIIVDTGKIVGQQIGPLSDYIAMLALSQVKSYDDCQALPSITNLMASGCGSDAKPSGLTDIDVAYLRGLYKASVGATFVGERGAIAYEMKKDLGGY
jgi:hypothetical protein